MRLNARFVFTVHGGLPYPEPYESTLQLHTLVLQDETTHSTTTYMMAMIATTAHSEQKLLEFLTRIILLSTSQELLSKLFYTTVC
jgi:hypothetical protein